MLKRVLTNLVLLGCATALALTLAELGIRLLLPHFDPSGHLALRQSDDGVPLLAGSGPVRQIKNTGDFNVVVRVNKLGLREDKDLSTATGADYFVVGDSYALGWGVEAEDRFSNVLERLLRGPHVFNISTPTDLDGYARLLAYARSHGATIRRVIVAICVENDLLDYGTKDLDRQIAEPVRSTALFDLHSIKQKLTSRSALYFFVTSVVHGTPLLRKLAIEVGFITPNLEAPHLFDIDLARIAPTMRRLREIIDGYDEVAILIVPSRALWIGSGEQRTKASVLHNNFVTELRAAKLRVADPRARMEATSNPLAFHFKNDGHWNPTGHALAAQMLGELIATQK